MDAQTIADALLSTLQKWGLNLSFLVGQGYDGAPVMSASRNGVQAKIAEKHPHATYIHCRSHVLNLAISSSCTSVPSIRNIFDHVHKLTWFLSGSAKRKEIFLEVASNVASNNHDQELLDSLMIEEDLSESMAEIEAGSRRHHVPKSYSQVSYCLREILEVMLLHIYLICCSTGCCASNSQFP